MTESSTVQDLGVVYKETNIWGDRGPPSRSLTLLIDNPVKHWETEAEKWEGPGIQSQAGQVAEPCAVQGS